MTQRPFYAATTVRTGWCQESQVGLPDTYIALIQKGDRNDKIKTQVDGSFRRLCATQRVECRLFEGDQLARGDKHFT